jgi:hypothetical protein
MYSLFILLGIFGGGFQIIPILGYGGALFFHIEARHAQHQPLTQQINSGTKDVKVVNVKGKLGYFETGYGIFAVALTVLITAAMIYQWYQK